MRLIPPDDILAKCNFSTDENASIPCWEGIAKTWLLVSLKAQR